MKSLLVICVLVSIGQIESIANEIKTRSIVQSNDISPLSDNENNRNSFKNDQIINIFARGISSVNTPECEKDLNATLQGIYNGNDWAIAMYDSSVKSPNGVEYGSVYQFGNYDQCMNIKTNIEMDGVDIKPKYCLADVIIDGYNIREYSTRNKVITNTTLVHWGICMPQSCSSNDIKKFLITTTGHENVTVTNQKCTINEQYKTTMGDIIFGCIITSFVLMVLFSTAYHIYMMYRTDPLKLRTRGCFEMIMKSFSIVENLHKMVKGSSDDLGLSCINGIKALAMIFIVASHALLFMVGGPVENSVFYLKETKLLQNAFLLNSPLLVDSFLLLSGFLFARLLLIELEKRRGKINFALLYLFRYIRLTPAYLAMIMLYITWMPKLGDGPMWKSRMNTEIERCTENWWTNILYINNYVGNDKMCMFQSWYLAADTQLFILAPLILYPLYKCRKLGLTLLTIVTIISAIIPFVWTYVNNLDPTFLVFSDEVSDLSLNDYFINTYVKTHMRATAYFFGLLSGFIVHVMQEKNVTLPRPLTTIFWIISIIIGSASMFTLVLFYDSNYQSDRMESALYAGLHRVGWSLSSGWLVIACVCGYANPIKKLLSSRPLIPLSRLTYCAYLTNGFVELYQASSLRTPKFMSVSNLLGETLSHTCLTFLAALILCLIFESPIHGIEKIFLKRDAQKQKDNQSNTPSTSEESA